MPQPSASTAAVREFRLDLAGSAVQVLELYPRADCLSLLISLGGAMSEMVIYALQVGGGTLALSPLPGRYGDYESDLDLIASWAPGLVLSMTTEVEMLQHGARHFGADIQSRACRWVHLPINDFGVPERVVLDQWQDVSASARQALSGGGRVLVHCKGGCGRSGMIALRLMIECGEKPRDALARLRSVRPCAVETDEQLQWASTGRMVRVLE